MSRCLPVLALTVLFVGACSENGLAVVEDPGVVDAAIEVAPPLLDFGLLASGEEKVLSFTVTSVGVSSAQISEMEIQGNSSFTLLTDLVGMVIPVGASETVDVSFTPLGAGELSADALVFADGVNDPGLVELIADGAVPELQIDPNAHAFGATFVGCDRSKEISLKSVGTEDLIIDGISLADPSGSYALTDTNLLPLTLVPGSSASVLVDFIPGSENVVTASLDVTSNDPRVMVSGTQEGEGRYGGWIQDGFTVPIDPPIDLIFAVDQSCSMDGHATNLGNNFSTLIGDLDTVTNGWKVGVVTLDTGCFNAVVTQGSPAGTFTNAVTLGTDASVTLDEKLFQMVTLALTKTAPGQCNAGFKRPGALLHVVFVTDEWEQSAISPASFVATGQGHVTATSLFKASGIVCPPSGCPAAGSDGHAGGYSQAIALTGGVREDITSSTWGAVASQIASASLSGIGRFQLSMNNPDPNSIEVRVNGTVTTANWFYDASTNEVIFTVPLNPGDAVLIDYGTVVNCSN